MITLRFIVCRSFNAALYTCKHGLSFLSGKEGLIKKLPSCIMGAVANVFVAWCMLLSRRQKSSVNFPTLCFSLVELHQISTSGHLLLVKLVFWSLSVSEAYIWTTSLVDPSCLLLPRMGAATLGLPNWRSAVSRSATGWCPWKMNCRWPYWIGIRPSPISFKLTVNIHHATVTVGKTVAGACGTNIIIAAVGVELPVPLKWLFGKDPGLLQLIVSFCLQSNIGASSCG